MVLFLIGLAKLGCFLPLHLVMETYPVYKTLNLERPKMMDSIYKRTNVMQLGSMFICNCNIALRVLDAFCVHLQEHLEIVEAASGE